MHQQVRTSTKKRSESPGPGAMADQGGLVDILEILLGEDINLRTAGGRDLDTDGQFVFSVHHEADADGEANRSAAQILRDKGYEAGVYDVHSCVVSDEPGSLLRCIQETEDEHGPVYEIFVGTPAADGHIPIQITTRADVGVDPVA